MQNSYEITGELKLRKVIESNTDYSLEFCKNDDKYGYDLICKKLVVNGDHWRRDIVGYVELEISDNWIDSYPAYWKTYSFLARKAFYWDYNSNEFYSDRLKNADTNRTIYVISNKSMTDMVVAKMTDVAQGEMVVNGYDSESERKKTFLRFDLKDTRIIRGLENTMQFINNYF